MSCMLGYLLLLVKQLAVSLAPAVRRVQAIFARVQGLKMIADLLLGDGEPHPGMEGTSNYSQVLESQCFPTKCDVFIKYGDNYNSINHRNILDRLSPLLYNSVRTFS